MDKDTKEILEDPKIMKMVKKGEQEIKDGKKILWKYKTTIPNIEKLKEPVNLKELYYKQFEGKS